MTDTARVRGTPHEIALLAGGPRAAVTVAVVALHLRGAVEAGAPGTVRAVDNEAGRALPPLPEDGVPAESRVLHLEGAVHRRLHEPCDVPEVARDPDVRWMLAELRVGLADDGMLGLPLLRPTRAARRRLHVLRTACPVPASRAGLSDEAKLLAVALHGEAALRVLVPRFALRAGLVERVRLRRRRPLRLSSRHHGNGGGYTGHLYCGGGGGCGSGCGGGCGGGGGP